MCRVHSELKHDLFVNTDLGIKIPQTHNNMNITEQTNDSVNDDAVNDNQISESDEQLIVASEAHDHCAAMQTRAMVAKESKPPKPLKIK